MKSPPAPPVIDTAAPTVEARIIKLHSLQLRLRALGGLVHNMGPLHVDKALPRDVIKDATDELNAMIQSLKDSKSAFVAVPEPAPARPSRVTITAAPPVQQSDAPLVAGLAPEVIEDDIIEDDTTQHVVVDPATLQPLTSQPDTSLDDLDALIATPVPQPTRRTSRK